MSIIEKEGYICARCGAEIYSIKGSIPPPKGHGSFDSCPIARRGEHVWRLVPEGVKSSISDSKP